MPRLSLCSVATRCFASGRSIPIAAVCGLALVPEPAGAVIAPTEMTKPAGAHIALWNGSSAVPIAPTWLISAKHVGGTTSSFCYMSGRQYYALEVINHPTMDLTLIRVSEEMPGWQSVADPDHLSAGIPCVMAGYGVSRGTAMPNNAGWHWDGPNKETWASNTLESGSGLLWIDFDRPGNADATAFEGMYANNDSGGGLMVYDEHGDLRLAGVAVSVTNWGSAPYQAAAFCLNVTALHNWILPKVDPERPIASSIQAPGASFGAPVVGAMLISVGVTLRMARRAGARR